MSVSPLPPAAAPAAKTDDIGVTVVNVTDQEGMKSEDGASEGANVPPVHLPLLPENSFFHLAPQRRIRYQSVFLLAILPVVTAGGLCILFLLWFLLHLYTPSSAIWIQHAFILDEGSDGNESQLRGLTISSVMSQAVSITSPFVMSLFAYRIATEWTHIQDQHMHSNAILPNPVEYGLIVTLMGAPSIGSLYTSGRPLILRHARAQNLLWSAFIFALFVFGMTHLIGLCDLWLHTTTTTIVANTSLPLSDPLRYGVRFNESLCPNGPIDPEFSLPCQNTAGAWASKMRYLQTNGFVISTNSSLLSDGFILPSVQTLANSTNLAIAVPRSINPAFSFTAPTFGVRAICQSLTPQCHISSTLSTHGISNCSGAGYPQLPFPPSTDAPYRLDDGLIVAQIGNISAGVQSGGMDLPVVSPDSPAPYPNPVSLLLQLAWSTYTAASVIPGYTPSCDAIGPWTGTVDGLDALIVISACNLTWYNITVKQSAGSFSLVDEEECDPMFAAVLWSPLLYQFATQHLESYLQSLALNQNNSDTLMSILEAELARQAMGFAASMFDRTNTSEQALDGTKLLGRYPAAPVLTMVALLGIYTVVVFLLSVWIVAGSVSPVIQTTGTEKDAPTVVDLTQLRLTTPLALAAQIFSKDKSLSMKPSLLEMFGKDTENTPVGIGMTERDGQPCFEVHDITADR